MKNWYYKLLASGTVALMSSSVFANNNSGSGGIQPFDPTKDLSGGKKLTDVLDNADTAAQTGTTFFLNMMTLVGFVIVAISLLVLWRASKEDGRERPVAGFIGLFMGGLMAGVGTVAWIIRNSLLG
ncbi:hypothetical protein L1281_001755 [Neisseria sp. HSC-16F19]|nr:hypothetical protein [Neisseria sp. HSC-16F19]MCP2041161.1 hypothetical protein [Neisseria sp. HSC-16F19]